MAFLPGSSGKTAVEVYALPTGHLSHPDRWIFEDGSEDWMGARHRYPNYSFLIRHHSGPVVLFDLGLAKDPDKLPDVIKAASKWIEPAADKDMHELLADGPFPLSSVQTVVLSHLHFDHVGDSSSPELSHVEIIAGHGSKAAASPGWPHAPNSPFPAAAFEHPRYRELRFEKQVWAPLGPFPRAHDFFGDGTFFLVDTPGHMPGHLGALALTGRDEWVFMGGDCGHHRALLMGTKPMSLTVGPSGTTCFHKDPQAALQTLDKIRTLEKTGDVLVALAHDSYLEDSIPEYPKPLNGWKDSEWRVGLEKRLKEDFPGA